MREVDSWLEWVALEVDHHDLGEASDLEAICEVLNAHLRTRTYLVGQRLTLADVSAAVSLRQPFEKARSQ